MSAAMALLADPDPVVRATAARALARAGALSIEVLVTLAHDEDPVVDVVVSMHVRRLVGEGRVYAEMSASIPELCARAGVSEADAETADQATAGHAS